MSEDAAPIESSAPAADTAPAQTAPETSAQQSAPVAESSQQRDDRESAAIAALVNPKFTEQERKTNAEAAYAGKGADGATAEPGQPEPVAEFETALSDQDIHLLSRWKFEGDALIAVESIPPALRSSFLAHLEETTKFTAQQVSEVNRLRQQVAKLQQSAPAAPQGNPKRDAMIEKAKTLYGDEAFAKQFVDMVEEVAGKKIESETVQQQESPAPQSNPALDALQYQHAREGWKAVATEFPFLKLDARQKQQVEQRAANLFGLRAQQFREQGRNPIEVLSEYTVADAIQEATASLFKPDIEKQAAMKIAKQGRQAFRGSPDARRAPGDTSRQLSKEDRESEAARRIISGEDPEAVRVDLGYAVTN